MKRLFRGLGRAALWVLAALILAGIVIHRAPPRAAPRADLVVQGGGLPAEGPLTWHWPWDVLVPLAFAVGTAVPRRFADEVESDLGQPPPAREREAADEQGQPRQ
jgi:hypothetical protein